MSIGSVKLPKLSDSSSESESDFEPPVVNKPKAPKRVDLLKDNNPDPNMFEINETEGESLPKDYDYAFLGLPPLSFDSDPFLSPIKNVQFSVRRHRIWIRGIKGVKFSLSIGGVTILVAKRKTKYLKQTWFISRSTDFSISTPNLAGILIKQRTGSSFTLIGPKERQTDQHKQLLAGIQLGDTISVSLGNNFWIPPEQEDFFDGPFPSKDITQLKYVPQQYEIQSVKNAAFTIDGEDDFCLKASKTDDKTVVVVAKAPLNLVQAFGITISLFMQ